MGVFSKEDGLKFKDTITKQDLVEYAITKKVEELTKLRTKVYEKYKQKSKERDEVKAQINQAKKDAESKHIQDNYGDIIKLLEIKKGTTHEVISSTTDKVRGWGRDFNYMIGYSIENNILVVIPNKETKKSNKSGWGMHPYDMYPDEMAAHLLSTIGTVITISRDEIVSDEVNSLKAKFDELDEECKKLDKKKNAYDSKITKVRNQKDTIKANIIEQALSSNKEGLKMLESLQNIDFGIDDTKLIK